MERDDGSPRGSMTALSLYCDPVEPAADVVHGGRCAETPAGGPAEDERPCGVFSAIGLGIAEGMAVGVALGRREGGRSAPRQPCKHRGLAAWVVRTERPAVKAGGGLESIREAAEAASREGRGGRAEWSMAEEAGGGLDRRRRRPSEPSCIKNRFSWSSSESPAAWAEETSFAWRRPGLGC
jgi:hypothetical protein